MDTPKDTPKPLTIGKLAAAANVNVETIRYYQRLNLIREPDKPIQGYRKYPASHISRIRFIKRSQQLGFTLKEISDLLELGDGHCQEVQELATQKIHKIDERISDLQAMSEALNDLLSRCHAGGQKDAQCALIEILANRTSSD